jgi:uncharacterized membrane protein
MANANAAAGAADDRIEPKINKIGPDDLKDALAKGLEDFKAIPSHLILLLFVYPLVCLVLVRIAAGHTIVQLLFPIVSGFALIGPVAAVGLYEISRRRDKGLDATWKHAFDVIRSPSMRTILELALIQLVIYLVWLPAAQLIYWAIFGAGEPASFVNFIGQVFTTPNGWFLIIVGCGVGALFALAVLTISVVSFPMVIHRDVSARMAIRTSIKAVQENTNTMVMWGVMVVILLGVGSIPLFVGLAVVMPVLGHATWHLYRKVVEV